MKNKPVVVDRKIKNCEDTIELKHHIEKKFLELGARLKAIRDHQMWEGRWSDFDEYLDQALKITKGTASKLIGIYETLVVEHNIDTGILVQASWTNLSTILPVIKSGGDALEWVDRAIHLSREDLMKEKKENTTGIEMRKCKHPADKCEKIIIIHCLACGDKWREYNETK